MNEALHDVQRIVLRGTRWDYAEHLMLGFKGGSPLSFLCTLSSDARPTASGDKRPQFAVSLGFTRRGLERANVPAPLLACFALKAPAFWAGAAMRAAGRLGMVYDNDPNRWDDAFAYGTLDAVFSIHTNDPDDLNCIGKRVRQSALSNGLSCVELPNARALERPPGTQLLQRGAGKAQWTHFGFRDGLSRIGIEGWTSPCKAERFMPTSRHEPGEFVLGHVQDSGANPWVGGPGLSVWSGKVRAFFHNGSFGVLHQIHQHAAKFEAFALDQAGVLGLTVDQFKGKLCGRYPDGRSIALGAPSDLKADFDYAGDARGDGCPFGSHVRRMNPRLPPAADADVRTAREDEAGLAQFSRTRALLRRGMPYGPSWDAGETGEVKRGLIGQFFCASIEDQYEHLLGEWADRVPLGSPDRGGARDPLIGAHERTDGPFEIPQSRSPAIRVEGMRPFTETLGVAYLFYPSLTTFQGISQNSLWGLDHQSGDG